MQKRNRISSKPAKANTSKRQRGMSILELLFAATDSRRGGFGRGDKGSEVATGFG